MCTSDAIAKAKDMRRDPRVALSLTDITNPYRIAAIRGRVVEVRSDERCRYMDPISQSAQRRYGSTERRVTAPECAR